MADNKPVQVTTQSGKTGFLPAEFAQDAAQEGVRRATDAEMQAAQRKANEEATQKALDAKFEGNSAGLLSNLEGQFAPQLAGALRGASLGFSDQAAVGLGRFFGGEDGAASVAGRLTDYKDYAPVGSFGGELAGITGATLLGNEGAGVEGASSLARIIGRSALEGAVYGSGDAVSEAALGNHALTAEALLGGAAHGAVGGAVAGGVLGGAGKLLSKLRKPSAGALEAVAGAVNGGEVSGVGEDLAAHIEGYRKPSSLADSVANKYIENVPGIDATKRKELADVFANREASFGSRSEITEKATRETTSAFDDVLSAGRETDMSVFGEAKKVHTTKLIDASKLEEQKALTDAFFEHADEIVQGLREDANSAMTKGDLKQWNSWVREARSANDSASLYGTLDDAKRWMGKEAEFGRGPFGLSRSTKEFTALYNGSADSPGLMRLLENEAWGGQARAQKEINSATERMLSEGKLFNRKFSTQYDSAAGRPLYRADPSAISGFYGRLTSAANDLDAEAAQNYVKTRRRYLDAVESNYEQTEAGVKAIAKERAGLDRMEKTVGSATKDVSRINQVTSALSEERERGIGGAMGAVIDIANKPYTTLQRIAALEQQTSGVLKKINGDVGSIVGGKPAAKAASIPSPRKGPGFFSALLEGATNVGSKSGGAVGGHSGRALFEKRADQIGALAASPDRVASQVSHGLSEFEHAAPNVTAEAVGVAARGVSFLQAKLPSLRKDPFSLQQQLQRPRASDSEISKFFRYSEALDNPLIVLQEAKGGTLSRDHVEAVKAVYPELYAQMRGAVFDQLVKSETPLSYAKEIQLGILLDLPTNRTLDPTYIATTQATFTPAESAGQATMPSGATGPQPGMAPEIAGSFQTATQSATEGVQ